MTIWAEWQNYSPMAQDGAIHTLVQSMSKAEAVVICVSDEYAASANAMGELYHAIICLGKPAVVAVVGSDEIGHGRQAWAEGRVGELVRGIPLVDFRVCRNFTELTVRFSSPDGMKTCYR